MIVSNRCFLPISCRHDDVRPADTDFQQKTTNQKKTKMKTRIASLIDGQAIWRTLPAIFFAASLLLVAGRQSVRASSPGSPNGPDAYAHGVITHTERIVLHDDIIHYRYDVRVGPGEFDVIRLHRIVRERVPDRPIHTVDGLFMLPGYPNSFEAIFMTPLVSSALPWDHSLVAYLAKNDIDVWGIDYAWALVPAETTDFSFMQGWGLAREMRDIDIGLGIAQSIRRATGQGSGRLHLLGLSIGAISTYALAAEETQKPYGLRKIKGIIPVDYLMKTNDEGFRLNACGNAVNAQARIDAGTYQDAQGVTLKFIADLAETAPDDPSPVVPVFTNRQFFLFAITSGEFWHFAGGDTEDLLFTDTQVFIDVAQAIPPYTPLQVTLDINLARCDEVDVPFDDHLGDITVPILYVGGAGGAGQLGVYNTTLTASTDVTIHIVQRLPDDMRAVDFGHADLFLGRDAEALVWEPILDWITAHASPSPVQTP